MNYSYQDYQKAMLLGRREEALRIYEHLAVTGELAEYVSGYGNEQPKELATLIGNDGCHEGGFNALAKRLNFERAAERDRQAAERAQARRRGR